MPEEKKEINYQKIAEKFGVRFFTSFCVKSVVIEETYFHAAIAEVYEKGSWRKVVITGRLYRHESTARSIRDEAEAKQKILLESLSDFSRTVNLDKEFYDFIGFPNPIDHMEPAHEL